MSKVLSSLGKCVLVDKVAGCIFLIRTDLPTKNDVLTHQTFISEVH